MNVIIDIQYIHDSKVDRLLFESPPLPIYSVKVDQDGLEQ